MFSRLGKMMVGMMIVVAMMMPMTAMAQEYTHIAVSPSDYVDTTPRVYGGYITWVRGVDLDNDGVLIGGGDWKEPTWIMVQETGSGRAWNITPAYEVGVFRQLPDMYYHAESPDIYNGQVIYDYAYADDSWDVYMGMYNISRNQTWENVPTPHSNNWCSGHEHRIFDDWIISSHGLGASKYAYLYNYKTQVARTLENTVQTGNYALTDEYAVWTTFNGADYDIHVYDIAKDKEVTIDFADNGVAKVTSGTIYDQKIGIRSLEVSPSSWDSFVLDMGDWNWTAITDGSTFGWTTVNSGMSVDMPNDIIAINTNSTIDTGCPYIWDDMAYYFVNGTSNDIWAFDMDNNRTTYVTTTGSTSIIYDVYNDKVVWYDNINSVTRYGDYRDNWDIYRTQTATESITNTVYGITPLILIMIVVGGLIGALTLLTTGRGGML